MSFFVLLVSAHAQNDYTTTLREPPRLENEMPSILVSTIDANTVERIDTDFIMPPFLRQGDSVALIAPSYGGKAKEMNSTADVLRSWGLVPIDGGNLRRRHAGRLAGNADERLADFQQAIDNPSIKALICFRGGYGAIQLLSDSTPDFSIAQPKWIIGYSDITTLHSLVMRHHWMSLHSAVGKELPLSQSDTMNTQLLHDLLFGHIPIYTINNNCFNRHGQARGRLVGGNLCSLVSLLGTSFDPTIQDSVILFIEDIGESFHNIDRMLHMLRLHGVFSRCKGLIVGSFDRCLQDLQYASAYELIRDFVGNSSFPVLYGFPTGHSASNYPLIQGSHVSLTVGDSVSTLTFESLMPARIINHIPR